MRAECRVEYEKGVHTITITGCTCAAMGMIATYRALEQTLWAQYADWKKDKVPLCAMIEMLELSAPFQMNHDETKVIKTTPSEGGHIH